LVGQGYQRAKDMVFSLSRSPVMDYGYNCTHIVIAVMMEANARIILQNISDSKNVNIASCIIGSFELFFAELPEERRCHCSGDR
jgi:hypothetical protein